MHHRSLAAFEDEMSKIAGLRDIWQRFLDVFRPEQDRVQRKVDYQFSARAGGDKWDKLIKNVRDPKFMNALSKHPDADDKLLLHAKSMAEMSRGSPVGKIFSATSPGKSYEIRKIPGGLACQCNDWRYKGSVNPGYECKHIQAHKAGKVKAA